MVDDKSRLMVAVEALARPPWVFAWCQRTGLPVGPGRRVFPLLLLSQNRL